MKTHLNPIRRTVPLALAVLAITAAASVSAQTVITPDLKAPPSAYNTSSTGMVLRASQIASLRTPGDQNSLANIVKQLSGVYGVNIATNGPLTGGLWAETYLNHTLIPAYPVLGDVDWYSFTAPALVFPGIDPNTTSTNPIAYEIITYLNLPAGTNTLKVGCGDAYKIYIGTGDNPYSLAAVSPAQFDGSRGYAVSTFDLDVQSAGVYPVRIIFGQAGDQIAGLQFYSVNGGNNYLINDPNGGGLELTSYKPATLPIPPPSLAYVSLLAPVPGETGVSPQPILLVQLTDGTATTVNTNTISLSFDGGAVSPTITQTGNVTYVSYTVPGLLTNLTTHTAQIGAQDSAANGMTNQWSFTVGQFTVVPATWAYPASSGDLTAPGFSGKIHQMVFGANAAAAVGTADAQISGQSGFANMVVTNGNPIIGGGWVGTQPANFGGSATSAATFNVTNAVNFSIDASGAVTSAGNFTGDLPFPGLPGSQDNTFTIYDNVGELAVEVLGWIQLPAGLSRIGVNNNDTFQLAISPNDARDIFRTSLAQIEGNHNPADSTVTVFVETNGIYSFRLIFRSYRNTAPSQLELYRYDETTGNPVLINDTSVAAVKSYRTVTVPTRPYVKSVSPVAGASGVGATDPISVVLVNKSNNVPVLKVNGSTVAYTSVTNGSEVTITYTPASPLSGVVNCEVSYGIASGTWSFKTSTGQKAVFISSGVPAPTSDQFVGSRLATIFGLDVEYVDDDVLLTNTSLSLVSNKVLVVISSTVTGSKPENLARQFMTNGWTIPVIFWEAALADDFGFATGAGSGPGSLLNLDIVNATNALTAGLTNGTYTVYTSGGDAQKYTIPTVGYSHVFQAALRTGTPTESRIAGIQKGAVLASGDYFYATGPITNASRKVFLGLLGNGNANLLNTNGLALLDAAITWAVQPVITTQQGPGAGNLTMFWSSAGKLQTATNLAAPAWITAPIQANPQTVPLTDPQRYYRVKQDW